MAPLILITDTNRMTLPLAVANLRGAGAGRRRLRRDRGGRRRARAAVHRALPHSPAALRARLHVRRFQGMTMTSTHHPGRPRGARLAAALRPLGLDEVRITGGFWARPPARERHRDARAHRALARVRRAGSPNFDLAAAGTLPEGRRGREFSDSEVYKYLEALAWEIGRTRRRRASRRASAPSSTGSPRRRSRTATSTRGSAGPARSRAGPTSSGATSSTASGTCSRPRSPASARGPDADDGLLGIARRAADLVCDVFGEGGIESICGHAEIEVGLAELGRAHRRAALPRAGAALRRAPRPAARSPTSSAAAPTSRTTCRCARPTILRGHAVRANYLAAGAVDVAVDTGDAELLDALRAPVGPHDRPPHLHHRRAGLAPPGRGVRRRLGAAAGPRLLRDLRGHRLDHVRVAAAARRRRSALRRPDRADPLQRRRDLAERRRPRLLLRQHPAPAGARASPPTRTRPRRARRRRCARRGSRCRAARRTSPARSRASPPTSRRPTTTASSCTSTRRRRSARRSPTGAAVAFDVDDRLPRRRRRPRHDRATTRPASGR